MSYETVLFEVKDGVATMTLNRPKQLNCFNQTMFKEWNEIISHCAYNNDVRVLVITGNGRSFSSGVDLSILGSDRFDPAQFRYYYRQNHLGFDNLEALEKPVIAAINGLCYGGGIELALSCDVLISADDAKLLPDREPYRLHSGERRLQPHDPLCRSRQDQGDGDSGGANRCARSVANWARQPCRTRQGFA